MASRRPHPIHGLALVVPALGGLLVGPVAGLRGTQWRPPELEGFARSAIQECAALADVLPPLSAVALVLDDSFAHPKCPFEPKYLGLMLRYALTPLCLGEPSTGAPLGRHVLVAAASPDEARRLIEKRHWSEVAGSGGRFVLCRKD